MANSTTRYQVRFTGHVQGVGFRMTAVTESKGLRVHGFVRNEPDGSVSMDVEGPQADLKELIRRIQLEMSGKLEATSIENREPTGQTGGLVIRY